MKIVQRYNMYSLALPNVPGTRNIISQSYMFISLFLPYELYDISMLARKTRQYNIIFIFHIHIVSTTTTLMMIIIIITIMIWHLQISARYT